MPPRELSGTRLRAAARKDVAGGGGEQADDCAFLIPDRAGQAATKGNLFVLARGEGLTSEGEPAAKLVVDTIIDRYYADDEEDAHGALGQAVTDANQALYERGRGGRNAPVSTCTCAVICRDQLLLVRIGASRVLRVREDMTERFGDETDEAPTGGLLGRFGLGRRAPAILGRAPELTVEIVQDTIQAGDIYAFCTPNLADSLGEDHIATLVRLSMPDDACEALVEEARRGGARGNLSVIVAEIEQVAGAVMNTGGTPPGSPALPAPRPPDALNRTGEWRSSELRTTGPFHTSEFRTVGPDLRAAPDPPPVAPSAPEPPRPAPFRPEPEPEPEPGGTGAAAVPAPAAPKTTPKEKAPAGPRLGGLGNLSALGERLRDGQTLWIILILVGVGIGLFAGLALQRTALSGEPRDNFEHEYVVLVAKQYRQDNDVARATDQLRLIQNDPNDLMKRMQQRYPGDKELFDRLAQAVRVGGSSSVAGQPTPGGAPGTGPGTANGTAAPAPTPPRAVTLTRANLRTDANTKAAQITVLEADTLVEIIGNKVGEEVNPDAKEKDVWYQVRVIETGQTGWLYSDVIKKR